MEPLSVKDGIYIVALIVTAVVTFLGSRYKLKEYARDKSDALSKDIHQLQLDMKDLKHKDELQQQVIDQIGKQIDSLIPKLQEEINKKKANGRK